jgi:hypothetical protein
MDSLGGAGIMALSVTAFGALGASFGISRDFFRKVFDKTDLWFKGITHAQSYEKVKEDQLAAGLPDEGRQPVEDRLDADAELVGGLLREHRPRAVVHFAAESHVALATPLVFQAMLWVIAYAWRQEGIAANVIVLLSAA